MTETTRGEAAQRTRETGGHISTWIPNRRLLLPHAAPYLAYVGIASLLGAHTSPEFNYLLRLLGVTLLLVWARQWFVPLRGPRQIGGSLLVGALTGLAGIAIWILLATPFAPDEGEAWSQTGFALRLLAAGLLVPVFEEYLMRGYVLRLALQWDRARREGVHDPLGVALEERSVLDVEPGAWSTWAVVVSTVAFTVGHQTWEWPAAMVFGLLMAWLWVVRRDLLSCVAAHAVANVAFAFYVRTTGQWQLW